MTTSVMYISTTTFWRRHENLAGSGLLAAIYYLSAHVGMLFAPAGALMSPVWPASGLAFGFLLLRGKGWQPGLILGVSAFVIERLASAPIAIADKLWLGSAMIAGFTLETLLGCWLFPRLSQNHEWLGTARNALSFACCAAGMAAISATTISIGYAITGIGYPGIDSIWLSQWLASSAGIAIVAPPLIACCRRLYAPWSRGHWLEALLIVASVTGVLLQVFGFWPNDWPVFQLAILLLPVLLWAAFRFNLLEAAILNLCIAGFAYWGTQQGLGPFVSGTPNDSLVHLQAYLLLLMLSVVTVAATVNETRNSQTALRLANRNLEKRVKERTTDLAAANRELQQYRDRLEELVIERTADLELANREIESFSYAVSHDLRTRLRAIDGYSHALLEDHAEQLAPQARHYLERSRAASQRMGRLIDDVLLLSRVTRHELELEVVNLSQLAQDICTSLQTQTPLRSVDISIAPQLNVHGDKHLLRILLENLLGNAWKYTQHQPQAWIRFDAVVHKQQPVFCVSDNGVGFDMQYADKLFHAFHRLHDDTNIEGTGIGLAIVARIMQRHSGQVWAEAEADQGAKFYFAFPERGRTTGPRKAINIPDETD